MSIVEVCVIFINRSPLGKFGFFVYVDGHSLPGRHFLFHFLVDLQIGDTLTRIVFESSFDVFRLYEGLVGMCQLDFIENAIVLLEELK